VLVALTASRRHEVGTKLGTNPREVAHQNVISRGIRGFALFDGPNNRLEIMCARKGTKGSNPFLSR